MTETPAENPATPLPAAPVTRDAVYDHGELRFVDPVKGETAKQTAARLNKDKSGRADGKSGNRYTVQSV